MKSLWIIPIIATFLIPIIWFGSNNPIRKSKKTIPIKSNERRTHS